jgi:Fur family ferric uptake transcriptional regulator
MNRETSLLERMQSRGLRVTSQRRILAELLEAADEHLDAEKIYQRARRDDPHIHRATVYRTLNTLKKHGLIDELDLMHYGGDRHYYEVRPSNFHIHLVCRGCGSVQEPGGTFWDELKHRVRRETNFQVDAVRLEMGGLCASCRKKRSAGVTG